MLKKLNVNLHKPYLSKAFDHADMKKALAYQPGVVYTLYCISNGVKEIQKFLSIDNPEFELLAHVRIKYAFVGKARQQVWNVKSFSNLIKIQPKYVFYCALESKTKNELLYYKKVETLKPETVYELIEQSYIDVQKILDLH